MAPRTVAGVVLAVVATGCSIGTPPRRPTCSVRPPITDAVIGIVAVAPAIYFGIQAYGDGPEAMGAAYAGLASIPFAVIGTGFLISAIYGHSKLESCRAADPPPGPPQSTISAHDRAFQLANQAAAASRAGDCTVAVQVDATVKALDADFHARAFVRHSAIARCLAAPTTAP